MFCDLTICEDRWGCPQFDIDFTKDRFQTLHPLCILKSVNKRNNIVSGIPAIRKIGLVDFLFGKEWTSTASQPKFGILPFILTSIYGTAGAIVIGVPIGFFSAVASPKVKTVTENAVNLLSGKMMTDSVDAYVKKDIAG